MLTKGVQMGHVMDIGIDGSYRHEATMERYSTPELDRIGFERILVTCQCGQVWPGDYEIGYFEAVEAGSDIEAEELVLGRWMQHVYDECAVVAPIPKQDEGMPAAWSALSTEERYASVAEHYIEVIERTVANMREALSTELSEFSDGSRMPRLMWAAGNFKEQGELLARRMIEIEEGK